MWEKLDQTDKLGVKKIHHNQMRVTFFGRRVGGKLQVS